MLSHPIVYPSIYEKYKRRVASFWTVDEVDLGSDLKDWEGLQEKERHFILTVLSFFATAEGLVNENLCTNFVNEVQIPEVVKNYEFQIGMESIHHDMYGILLTTYVRDAEVIARLNRGVLENKSIKKKAEWAMRWTQNGAPFLKRLVAFACVEGIFFSASFCAIFWLKKKGLMPGLTFSNELIARDEGMHRDFRNFHLSFDKGEARPGRASTRSCVRRLSARRRLSTRPSLTTCSG